MRGFCFLRLLVIPLFAITSAIGYAQSKQSTTLQNKWTLVQFDLAKGSFSVQNKVTGLWVVKDAFFSAGPFKSTDAGNLKPTIKNGGTALEVVWMGAKGKMIWQANLPMNKPQLLFSMAVQNTSEDTMQLKAWSPLSDGLLYESAALQKVKMLDGNGGGEATKVQDGGYLRCRNNALITAVHPSADRISWVGGGISYRDFEKHVMMETDAVRKADIEAQNKKENMQLISYLDLGEEGWAFNEGGTGLIVQRAWPYPFHSAKIRELGTTVYSGNQIVLEAQKLDPQKKYSIGLSWMDEGDARIQSVYIQPAGDTTKTLLLSKRHLPQNNEGQNAEALIFQIPEKFSRSGSFKILVEKDKGPNVVASEAWLNEGWPMENPAYTELKYRMPAYYKVNLYAQDPVGKRIDPGTWYRPVQDVFYLDVTTADPFTALETYSRELKGYNKINLSRYTFPTTCLWYASHHNYGGGPSVNDSPGAVEEMRRADSSGITKFGKAAIRLVPDHYGLNNEQGWWDDAHWQRYGSGDDNPNSVQVKGGHYKAPYLTTKSWASAISKMGGIPITYVQTARRSEDFATAYPQWMLFNQSFKKIPDSNWLTLGYSSYDFTDTGFIRHMRSVYKNLRAGGVRGMMFDYTSTAWADFGGMDDKYSTAAAMYRKVFELAYEGLGARTWIDERNLERGTDLTLGLVASQRVWGDTDGITDEMVSRTGLRWYKNRVVVSYDMDSKNTEKLRIKSRDYLRQMLTMAYVASGRLLLGNSYAKMTADDVYDMARVFPFHDSAQSARPVDAFVNQWPTVYDFKVNNSWHLLTLYNTSNDSNRAFNISLRMPNADGGLALGSDKKYHGYDFWNKKYLGLLNGNETLQQNLRPAEARMIALHEQKPHPQFISTNRHIYQGYLELKSIRWEATKKTYSGTALVVGGEPMEIIIAGNGRKPIRCTVSGGGCTVQPVPNEPDLFILTLNNKSKADLAWKLSFN